MDCGKTQKAMDKLDRIQELHRLLLTYRRPVPLRQLAERMECTEKTVKRTIEHLQNFFHVPISYVPNQGWQLAETAEERLELPGLWLTAEELQSLTLLISVLETFGNGLLREELGVIRDEVHRLLLVRGIDPDTFMERVKVLPIANRATPNRILLQISDALLRTNRLQMRYTDFRNKPSVRDVSPQALIYYRDNWYLDAWCHLREALRTFSVSRINHILPSSKPAHEVTAAEREQHYAASYGIFAGTPKQIATLRFQPAIAHEIAMQHWHPDQQGVWDGDQYVLQVPYSDDRELLRDVMRYLPDVNVEAPAELRQSLISTLHHGLETVLRQ